jgi:hypothetical protein
MANQNNVSLIGQYWNTSTKSNNDGQMSVLCYLRLNILCECQKCDRRTSEEFEDTKGVIRIRKSKKDRQTT